MLAHFSAVALLGPRQCGKTTLARNLCQQLGERAIYLDLERQADLAKLADPELFLAGQRNRLVVLDEVHRAPGLFQVLRGLIDERRRAGEKAGQFLLLGSAAIDLLRQSGESLAGRIAYLELTPFLANETVPLDLDRLWMRGGFPDSYLAADDSASFEWRLAFIRTYLERDIPQFGPRIPAETLRRFWTMLAHEQGALFNAVRFAGRLGISGQTVARYLDLMTDLLLVRRLPPWAGNAGKRLVKSPKVYIRDSGLAHALLGISSHHDLVGHPVQGGSWEGLVIENLVAQLPPSATASFYRTGAGAEIDLVLQLTPQQCWVGGGQAFPVACRQSRLPQRRRRSGGDPALRRLPGCPKLSARSLFKRVTASRTDGRIIGFCQPGWRNAEVAAVITIAKPRWFS